MDRIVQTFAAFEQQRVLIIGDVMIDRYLRGRVQRISPEAPVPVVQWQESEDRLGGAANVALNLKALGATPYLLSVIGKDDQHHSFLQEMERHALDSRGVLLSDERITTVKTRVIAQNQHLLRVDREDMHDLSDREAAHLRQVFRSLLDEIGVDVIIFQDYNKGVLRMDLIEEIIQEARTRGIPTVVDPKFRNFWAYRGVNLFKPNLREIQDQLDFLVLPTQESLQAAATVIRARLQNDFTLVTLSDKGLFVEGGEQCALIPTQARNIADVCGAGDTVISVAALALTLGMPMEEIGLLANLAGGQVCEKVGVVPVDKDQLQREYRRYAVSDVHRGR